MLEFGIIRLSHNNKPMSKKAVAHCCSRQFFSSSGSSLHCTLYFRTVQIFTKMLTRAVLPFAESRKVNMIKNLSFTDLFSVQNVKTPFTGKVCSVALENSCCTLKHVLV